MGENSKIEWCNHTMNFWTGCTKVSPACTHCYAESWAKRSGLVVWGDAGLRRRTSAAKWQEPYKWNRRAMQNNSRERVFVNSLSDWAEKRDELDVIRRDMFDVIRHCQWLDFLLLTKRADNILNCLPSDWGAGYPNVWLGTTVENQEWADKRIPHLLNAPAMVHFLSCEPLLGAIDLSKGNFIGGAECYCGDFVVGDHGQFGKDKCKVCRCDGVGTPFSRKENRRIDWVICGGESGHGARPMHPAWARSLRDQCAAAGVAFHFKQWGEAVPIEYRGENLWKCQNGDFLDGSAIDNRAIWDETMPSWVKVGKHAAGRLLDGRAHDEFPEVCR